MIKSNKKYLYDITSPFQNGICPLIGNSFSPPTLFLVTCFRFVFFNYDKLCNDY